MEQGAASRNSHSWFSSYEKLLGIGLAILAVASPLYINRRSATTTDLPLETQPNNPASWLPLLVLLFIFATTLSYYHARNFARSSCFASYERQLGIGLAILAVASPLYIDRSTTTEESDTPSINLTSWRPLLLLLLILVITLSGYHDKSSTRFDPYWIHRVVGSSTGICVVLMLLALVLKCKASLNNWEA
ncbi:hypothetical protein RJ641_005802 [Dillenia turbinata]|uniref:Transmembrane protein n=1 Tax=Dillenia turbinata TaxID=194707 RepID=A0AAN8Z6Y5_9MAGN